MTREPHDNNAGQDTKRQFQYCGDSEADQRVTIAALPFIFPVAAEKTGRNLGNHTRDKDNEDAHHSLNQCHGHHTAISDMADFMGNDRFRFITAHVL